jgi:hypothetical protein
VRWGDTENDYTVIPAKAEIQQSNTPRVRGCCRFIGFTTTAHPLRVRGQRHYIKIIFEKLSF